MPSHLSLIDERTMTTTVTVFLSGDATRTPISLPVRVSSPPDVRVRELRSALARWGAQVSSPLVHVRVKARGARAVAAAAAAAAGDANAFAYGYVWRDVVDPDETLRPFPGDAGVVVRLLLPMSADGDDAEIEFEEKEQAEMRAEEDVVDVPWEERRMPVASAQQRPPHSQPQSTSATPRPAAATSTSTPATGHAATPAPGTGTGAFGRSFMSGAFAALESVKKNLAQEL